MLKVIGVLLLMSSFAAIGFLKANQLTIRKKRLSLICAFIDDAAERIRIGEEMNKIIKTLGSKAGVYNEGYNLKSSEEGLKSEDISLINEFLFGFGMGDTASQLKRCENYSALFKRLLLSAETEVLEKAAVYRKLGVFAGVLVGVVLV